VTPCEKFRGLVLNPRSPISSLTEAQSSQSPILQYPLRPPCAPCLRVRPSDGLSSDLSILDPRSILSQRHKVHRVQSSEPRLRPPCSPCLRVRPSDGLSSDPKSSIIDHISHRGTKFTKSDPPNPVSDDPTGSNPNVFCAVTDSDAGSDLIARATGAETRCSQGGPLTIPKIGHKPDRGGPDGAVRTGSCRES